MRHQIGPDFGTPMPRDVFAAHVATRSGKSAQSITTYHRWEADEGRGPSLAEGVAIARLGGRTVAWLAGLEDADAAPVRDVGVSAPPASLRTQGDRIKWVRHQLGSAPWEPMTQPDFAAVVARQSGETVRHASTIHHWEHNRFDGPTLREAVAIARLVGRTAEWLSALDEAGGSTASTTPRGAVPGPPPSASRVVALPQPIAPPARKQGHGRGKRRGA